MRPWQTGDARRCALHYGGLLLLIVVALTLGVSVGGRFHAVAILSAIAALFPVGVLVLVVTRSPERTAIACAVGAASIVAIVPVAAFSLMTGVSPWGGPQETIVGGGLGALAYGLALAIIAAVAAKIRRIDFTARSRLGVALAAVAVVASAAVLATATSAAYFGRGVDPDRYAPRRIDGTHSSALPGGRALAVRLVEDSKCIAEVSGGSQTTTLPMPSPSSEVQWDMHAPHAATQACRSSQVWTDSDGRLIFDTPAGDILQWRDVRAIEPGATTPHGVSSIDLARSLDPPGVWQVAAIVGAIFALAALCARRSPLVLRVMVAWTALATLTPPLLVAYACGLGR